MTNSLTQNVKQFVTADTSPITVTTTALCYRDNTHEHQSHTGNQQNE